MSETATPIEMLFEKAEEYVLTTVELAKLKLVDKSAEVVSSFAAKMALFIAVAVALLFVNIGLALWLGEVLQKTYYGFFAVALFYAVLAILLFVFKKQWIKTPISNTIIKKILHSK